jgi:hypothetical protein
MSKPKGDDRQWETLQVKAFVHWVNGYLERRGLKVEKLEEDFCDGVLLIAFIEELTGGKLNKRWNTNPTTRVLKIENCHQAIMLLKENYHIKNITISAEDITNGNLKLILGFLWLLFREFRIAKIEGAQDKSYEEGVLLWVRQTLRNYTDLNISNFSSRNVACRCRYDTKNLFSFRRFTSHSVSVSCTQPSMCCLRLAIVKTIESDV